VQYLSLMKAIELLQPGENPILRITDLAIPEIQSGEVLVQVKAISINPVDYKTSRAKGGVYAKIKDESPLIMGWDISGIVTKSSSEHFQPGQEVFGMVNFPGHARGYAEYVAAPAHHLALKPAHISHSEAAATSLAALTAYQALLKTGGLKAGQKVLIHAAAGGVGHFAVQIAKHFAAYVTGTSSAGNREFVLSLGADQHIDYHTSALENEDQDYDLVLDTIGGENIERSIPLIKNGGTLISIPSGANTDVAEKAAAKNVKGLTFMVKSDGDDMEVLAGYLKDGVVKPHISKTFPFDEMNAAFETIASGRTTGKITVTL
jgi:NADPH:quinone reductase-like Zn-dependent oxidoreductase